VLRLNNVVLIFLLFISLAVSYAFAENPTPYNKWDFDSGEIEISQDPRNLDDMIILIPVIYKGDMGLGTVEISARVSNPDGSQFTQGWMLSRDSMNTTTLKGMATVEIDVQKVVSQGQFKCVGFGFWGNSCTIISGNKAYVDDIATLELVDENFSAGVVDAHITVWELVE